MYIFIFKSSLGPFSTTWVAFPRVGYGRERFLYLRIVRNVCRGVPLRIFPSLDAREPLSSFLFSFPIAVRPLLTLFVIFVFARLAASLATKTDDLIARDLLSRCLSRSSRASSASALCSRAGSLRRDSRTLSLCLCVSRRLLSFIAVVGPENLMRVDAFAPPTLLRVTGICKSIYL